ncbi:MAG: sulfate permease [Actinobacteria bacterium]|nr:sulfate permease [Actinomycetota bacterium]
MSSEVMTPRGLHRWVPGLSVFTNYQRRWLRGDIVGGLTVAAYAVPQVMAYATIAGLPPVVGLWAILPALVVYALLGSSRKLSMGPESTTALMTAVTVGPLADGDAARFAVLSATLALIVGCLSLIAFIIRAGFIADLFSRPILVGYMAGIAALMIVGQLDKVTGVPVDGDGFLPELSSFFGNLSQFDIPTLIAGVILVSALLLMQWRFPHLPGPLIIALGATVIVAALGLQDVGLNVIGAIPQGLPSPALPSLADTTTLLLPAVGVLLVGYTDNVLTARSFAKRENQPIDPNQEFLALGVANVSTSFLQGFPVSSSASRTAVGVAAGIHTQLYSWVTAASILTVLLVAGPVLAGFPTVALGAIVIYAALRLVDVKEFRKLASFRRVEFGLAIAALVGVLAFGILYGVLFSVGLSVAELLIRTARPHDAVEGFVPGLPGMHDIDDFADTQTVPGLVVYRFDSPLFFANAEYFVARALQAVAENEPVRWSILNAEANVEVDSTALQSLDDFRQTLVDRGIQFGLARVKHDLYIPLKKYGLIDKIGDDHIYATLPTAVTAYRDWVATNPLPDTTD